MRTKPEIVLKALTTNKAIIVNKIKYELDPSWRLIINGEDKSDITIPEFIKLCDSIPDCYIFQLAEKLEEKERVFSS